MNAELNRSSIYQVSGWLYKPGKASLSRPGEERHLTPQLNRLLLSLVLAEDHTLSRDELIHAVWDRSVVSDDAVDRAVSELRKALRTADQDDFIRTRHGFGYTLNGAVRAEKSSSIKRYYPLAALALIIGLVFSVFWTGEPARSPLLGLSVAPIPAYTGLQPGKQYFPITRQLYFLEHTGAGSRISSGQAGIDVTPSGMQQAGLTALSTDGSRVAWIERASGCTLFSAQLENRQTPVAQSRFLLDCLETASHALGWSPNGSLVFAQLAADQLSLFEIENDERVISTFPASGCSRLKDIARRPDGRTYIVCATSNADGLFELKGDRLEEQLRYRSIERFAVGAGETFYLTHSPHWKQGVTRYTPMETFEFMHIGRVLDLEISGGQLTLVRDFHNTDLFVFNTDTRQLESIEAGPVQTRAFTEGENGDLWQLDDRAGQLNIYRNQVRVTGFDSEKLIIPLDVVDCISIDNDEGTIKFAGIMPNGPARVTHDLGSGTLLEQESHPGQIGCADAEWVDDVAPESLLPPGYRIRQIRTALASARVYILAEHSSSVDIAYLDVDLSN